jgi:hypothetical protein
MFVVAPPAEDDPFLPTATSVELGRRVLFVSPVELPFAALRRVEFVFVPLKRAVDEAAALEEDEDLLELEDRLEDDEDGFEEDEEGLGFQTLELEEGVHSGVQELDEGVHSGVHVEDGDVHVDEGGVHAGAGGVQ